MSVSLRVTNGLDIDGPLQVRGTLEVAGTEGLEARTLTAPSMRMLTAQSATLVTKQQVDERAQVTLPDGTICMFYGTKAEVPEGWRICDGSEYTPPGTTYTGEERLNVYPSGPKLPDLRNRFALGADMGSSDAASVQRADTLGKEQEPAPPEAGHNRRLTQLPRHTHTMEIKGTGSARGATSVLIPAIKSSEVQAGNTSKVSTGVAVQPAIIMSPGGAPGTNTYGTNHRHKDIGSAGKPTPDPYNVEPRNRKLYYIIKVKQ
jgi:hypothetical protein